MKIRAKYLHLLFFSENNIYVSLRQGITTSGEVQGIGGFAISSREQNQSLYTKEQSYVKQRKTMCMCLFCGDIDFSHLEQHHPYPVELPKFTITLCANCHRTLHFYTGGNRNIRK